MAWCHSHANGNKCSMSSIDLHNQYTLEQQYPHILAIVVEIGSFNSQKKELKRLANVDRKKMLSFINHAPSQDFLKA